MDSSSFTDWDFTTITLGAARGFITESSGKLKTHSFSGLRQAIVGHNSLLLCHRLNVARRLRIDTFPAFDVLELFAFVHPAVRCVPTPRGLATALGIRKPESDFEEGEILKLATLTLLETLYTSSPIKEPNILAVAEAMRHGKWEWADKVCATLRHHREEEQPRPKRGLDVWIRLPAWSEHGPEPISESRGVDPAEARLRLSELVGDQAEDRPEQGDYTSAVTPMFAPREKENLPEAVIAEAGTGVGKTLGYIAPASIWAEKNSSPVWISTYTKHLQRQIDAELEKLYPDPELKKRQVVIRKGRENYLCLLNFEEAVNGVTAKPGTAISIGLVARWAVATRDGDINGGDFPRWLSDLLGFRNTLGLSDRRGECLFSSCNHFNKCFIEKTVRKSRFADIVVSNHALLMTQAAMGGIDDSYIPTRLIFDEGHHVFDAADSAFSAEISGRQGAELRHWILGTEGPSRRGRGLAKRIQDFTAIEPKIGLALAVVEDAATCLPSSGWQRRMQSGSKPKGPAEDFLSFVRQQTYARAKHIGPD
ncbi:MAG: ATP-dependent DNA helicase, partial [Pseudomonadota bacterium]|nr:ATP-dependent DNA helicase [Pseudomonadota bacterium]